MNNPHGRSWRARSCGCIKDFKCDLPWAVSIGYRKRGSSVEMVSCARMLGSGPGAAFSPSGLLIDVIGGGAAMVSSHRCSWGGVSFVVPLLGVVAGVSVVGGGTVFLSGAGIPVPDPLSLPRVLLGSLRNGSL
jgi:hypothetical protein